MHIYHYYMCIYTHTSTCTCANIYTYTYTNTTPFPLQDSMFQGGDAVREALVCYQQDELNNIKPTIESLGRLVGATRVRMLCCEYRLE